MRFADVENIWTADLATLPNVDRGRVYFERAKQVVGETLADPAKFERAVRGKRFRRAYLVDEIGCQPAVTTQNPKIRQLLADTDRKLGRPSVRTVVADRSVSDRRPVEVAELRNTVDTLRRRVEAQDIELAGLRRELLEERARG